MEEITPIAFLASWALVVPFLERVLPQGWDYSRLVEDVDTNISPLQVAVKAAIQRVDDMNLYDQPTSMEMILRLPKPQRAMLRRPDELNAQYYAAEADHSKTPEDPHAPARDRLRAGCAGGTMGVTNYVMPPTAHEVTAYNQSFRHDIMYRLGAKGVIRPGRCCQHVIELTGQPCGRKLDGEGLHAIRCTRCAGR